MKKFSKYSYLLLLVTTSVIALGMWIAFNSFSGNNDETNAQIEETLPEDHKEPEKKNKTPYPKSEFPLPPYVLPTDIMQSDSEPIVESEPEPEPEEPKPLEFTAVDEAYFSDALFIGDSRTVGLRDYAPIGSASYFAVTSMSVYSAMSERLYVSGYGTVSLDELLSYNSFGKIYVMLGINELGYNTERTINKYADFIDAIRQYQPDAIVYVEGNMHVTSSRSNYDSIYNNERIDYLNSAFAQNADSEHVFYLDMNVVFDDENGALGAQYTGDNTHLYGKYYYMWAQWLMENAIVTPEMDYTPPSAEITQEESTDGEAG